mmetsp:Transcript_24503/g.58063  ORF Transcript_24503/g.58063 Transcript_24503/m.58063 type:complete len:242 (+) Transcript_24503:281-1006(+)
MLPEVAQAVYKKANLVAVHLAVPVAVAALEELEDRVHRVQPHEPVQPLQQLPRLLDAAVAVRGQGVELLLYMPKASHTVRKLLVEPLVLLVLALVLAVRSLKLAHLPPKLLVELLELNNLLAESLQDIYRLPQVDEVDADQDEEHAADGADAVEALPPVLDDEQRHGGQGQDDEEQLQGPKESKHTRPILVGADPINLLVDVARALEWAHAILHGLLGLPQHERPHAINSAETRAGDGQAA